MSYLLPCRALTRHTTAQNGCLPRTHEPIATGELPDSPFFVAGLFLSDTRYNNYELPNVKRDDAIFSLVLSCPPASLRDQWAL